MKEKSRILRLFSGYSLPFRSGNCEKKLNYLSLPNNSSKKQESLVKMTPVTLRLAHFLFPRRSSAEVPDSCACLQKVPRPWFARGPLRTTIASLQGRPGERKQDVHLTCHFPAGRLTERGRGWPGARGNRILQPGMSARLKQSTQSRFGSFALLVGP